MITEDYVSYEVAKLLKDKGFDEPCYRYYDNKGNVCAKFINPDIPLDYSSREYYLCPSQSMAMKWLREKYKISVIINPVWLEGDMRNNALWRWEIVDLETIKRDYNCAIYRVNYEEAVEAAIKYSLEKCCDYGRPK